MIKRLFSPPHFENEEDNFRAKFINGFGLFLIAVLIAALIPQLGKRTPDYTFFVLLGLIGVMVVSLYIMHQGYLRLSGIVIVVLTWAGITFQALTAGGVKDVIIVAYVAVSLLASIIISWLSGTAFIILSIAAIVVLARLEVQGILAAADQPPTAYARDLSLVFLAIAALIYISTKSLRDAISRANQSEQALLATNKSLQELNAGLEGRVASRTTELEVANERNQRRARQFEAIAQIARFTTSNQDLENLLSRLTEVISEQFGFYHTGIFLLDEDHSHAVLRAANSEGGKRMLQKGHQLGVGQTGIVGFVSATGNPRIALDVGDDAAFFDNPYLPSTHSEMALPLQTASEIMGVLDVQSLEVNAFHQEDIEVLSTLANLVTVAIQNAQSYERTQQLLKEAQRTSGAYLRETWKAVQSQQARTGYLMTGNTLKPLGKTIMSPQIAQAVANKATVVEGGMNPALTIPIRLRDEIIGVMDIRAPEGHDWDHDDVDIAEAVADRLSLAIESSMLLEATERRAEIERVTSDISGKISSSTQFEAILRTAAEELSRALGGSEVVVQLQTPETVTDTNG
jgi:GAF domain-containing protein